MPREGVPYPSREICSLKCQIDALNAKINELMKSINGVQGDGQGDLTLVSGDPAIVINNDQAQHEIEIALDQSALPSALVSSVNGQTGIVDLDGADIPLNPGQSTPTVQNAVAANAGAISQLQADLNQEVLDRGNADSALQTNVNRIGARVSVIEGQISEDPDPNTIGLRDANGRLKAKDPASGATDKTLVTANWVSQTGDSAPNNVAHRIADETYTGRKTFDSVRTIISNLKGHTPFNTNSIDIRAVYRIPASSQNFNINVILAHRVGILIARLNINSSGTPSVISKIDSIDNAMAGMDIGIVEDGGYRYICYKGPSQNANYPQLYVLSSFYSNTQMNVTLDDTTFDSNAVTFKSFGIWS